MPNYRELIAGTAQNLNVRDEFKHHTVDELKNIHDNDRMDYAVCALNVTGDLNVSMMMRSASLLGAKEFVIFGRRVYDKRGAVGVQNYLKLHRIAGLKEDGVSLDVTAFKSLINSLGYYPVFVEQHPSAVDIMNAMMFGVDSTSGAVTPPIFIFGNEGMGIPLEVMDAFDKKEIITIPQLGVLRSFNVAAAANIVMWEYSRR